jgi:hypothetical protein
LTLMTAEDWVVMRIAKAGHTGADESRIRFEA